MTSLAEDEGVCKWTIEQLRSALNTRRKYSNNPVLDGDLSLLVWISGRWIDGCLPALPPQDVSMRLLFGVADLVFAAGKPSATPSRQRVLTSDSLYR